MRSAVPTAPSATSRRSWDGRTGMRQRAIRWGRSPPPRPRRPWRRSAGVQAPPGSRGCLRAGRSGVFASRQGGADRLQSATVIQLGAGPLVGREDVVRSLVAAARDAAEGNVPSVTTVTAGPGYGKTPLAAALLERLRAQLPVLELMDLRAREPVAGAAGEMLRARLARALGLPPGAGEESARARFTAAVGRTAAAELWPAAALTLRLVPPDA